MNEPEKIIPGGYADFLNYLDTVTTEEALFSPLTYWFANQNTADDTRDRFDVVADRAKELKLWNGLDLKLERWARTNKEELGSVPIMQPIGMVSRSRARPANCSPIRQSSFLK